MSWLYHPETNINSGRKEQACWCRNRREQTLYGVVWHCSRSPTTVGGKYINNSCNLFYAFNIGGMHLAIRAVAEWW